HQLPLRQPAAQKEANERVASEVSIQLFEVLEIGLELLRHRLGTIHHFRGRGIEVTRRRKKIGRHLFLVSDYFSGLLYKDSERGASRNRRRFLQRVIFCGLARYFSAKSASILPVRPFSMRYE